MINPNDNVLYQGFKVQYRVVGRVGDWSVVTVYGIDKRSLVLSGMRPGLSYEVIVRASSDRSEGNPSHPVIITTLESGELNSSSKLWSHGLLSSTELWPHLLLFYLSRTSQTSLGQRGKRVNSLLDQNFLRIKEFIHKTFHRVPWVTDTQHLRSWIISLPSNWRYRISLQGEATNSSWPKDCKKKRPSLFFSGIFFLFYCLTALTKMIYSLHLI